MTTRSLHIALADPSQWADGLAVVEAAKQATGFPLNSSVEEIVPVFAQRQAQALGVWVAYRDDTCVGHALITRVELDVPKWTQVNDAAVREARAQGRLVELGSLAVHPDHHGQGIAGALVDARLDWTRRHGLLGCASVWNDAEGSQRLARRHGRMVGTHPTLPSTLYVYDTPPAAR